MEPYCREYDRIMELFAVWRPNGAIEWTTYGTNIFGIRRHFKISLGSYNSDKLMMHSCAETYYLHIRTIIGQLEYILTILATRRSIAYAA